MELNEKMPHICRNIFYNSGRQFVPCSADRPENYPPLKMSNGVLEAKSHRKKMKNLQIAKLKKKKKLKNSHKTCSNGSQTKCLYPIK